MKHIVHIDPDTDIGEGIKTAAAKMAATVPEIRARKLVSHIMQLVFMLEYIKTTGNASEQELRDLSIFRECLAYAELPILSLELTPHK